MRSPQVHQNGIDCEYSIGVGVAPKCAECDEIDTHKSVSRRVPDDPVQPSALKKNVLGAATGLLCFLTQGIE